MFRLTAENKFPPLENATSEGIVAIGGDLNPERVLLAYQKGIFPWFEEDSVIVWWSPDPRMVLYPENLKISKSLRKTIKDGRFKVTFNTCFEDVIKECAIIRREGQNGTWITQGMIKTYCKLHEMGYAKSVEVWEHDKLIGGLYGIDLCPVFCGESMFSKISNASKVGFVYLVEKLKEENYNLIDCQIYTDHLASLGAEEIPRDKFVELLNR